MDQVYMYMRVCIGVSACSEFICMCVCICGCICMDRVYMYKRVSIGVCMRQVYMYAQDIHNCICIHYKHNMYWYGFHISVHVYFIYIF